MHFDYVCSPFRGNVDYNIEQAKNYCRQISELGRIPIAPHLDFPQFLNDDNPVERTRGISFGIALMLFCEEVWVFGNEVSEGMRLEIEYANSQGKVVQYVTSGHGL
jgi:hypothetical protein